MSRCRSCGDRFDGEHWQKLCWPCWREQKQGAAPDRAYDRGWDDGYVAATRDRAGRRLDGELLRDLIALCHPDRHPVERFELANGVTARLLELRGALAA